METSISEFELKRIEQEYESRKQRLEDLKEEYKNVLFEEFIDNQGDFMNIEIPVFKHKDTGDTINGFNSHKGDISPDALRNTRKQVVAHHNKHGLTYISLDDKSL